MTLPKCTIIILKSWAIKIDVVHHRRVMITSIWKISCHCLISTIRMLKNKIQIAKTIYRYYIMNLSKHIHMRMAYRDLHKWCISNLVRHFTLVKVRPIILYTWIGMYINIICFCSCLYRNTYIPRGKTIVWTKVETLNRLVNYDNHGSNDVIFFYLCRFFSK